MGRLYDSLPDSFLKKVLAGEDSEIVENLLSLKKQYETETDKERKTVFRDRFANAIWNLYYAIGQKMSPNTPKEKRLFIRYGILDLRYLQPEDQKLILSLPFEEHDPDNSVFYVDEWLIEVLSGNIKPSMTDERPKTSAQKKDDAMQAKFERMTGALEAERNVYQSALERRRILEENLQSMVAQIIQHTTEPLLNLPDTYTESQLKSLDDLLELARDLKKADKELVVTKNSYAKHYEELEKVQQELNMEVDEKITYTVDKHTAENELNTIRQMIKMTVGRQGNHFPALSSTMMPRETRDFNFKLKTLERLRQVEELDYTLFQRTFRQHTNRVPPYVILVPGYGTYGMCWEPYDRYNKATSKGRVAIPIFSKNPMFSIVMAMGDFRWQVAKEFAGYHWMDEGLSGKYYEYISSNKIKGDIKLNFINDYILWMTKESEGIQKLADNDVRFIFWRYVPFPDKLKEDLSKRGYYYDKLYKNELSYRMSQGK
ncbi:hypothetical protein [Thermospira aquatica]|uniref:Uncharacterized protein n=1 Tax=Thermospira aquatica TaxID=2828656 RepID=A0AAX3BF89_9SPIR|nr:hypothetical protein [Thermospira aquatica]URA10749.1 hypothetical protein KDW03_02800 [Thermospira aquatica]